MRRRPTTPTLFPYTTLFRSGEERPAGGDLAEERQRPHLSGGRRDRLCQAASGQFECAREVRTLPLLGRSEEHTSELQSPYDLVCRLLLEKKKKRHIKT